MPRARNAAFRFAGTSSGNRRVRALAPGNHEAAGDAVGVAPATARSVSSPPSPRTIAPPSRAEPGTAGYALPACIAVLRTACPRECLSRCHAACPLDPRSAVGPIRVAARETGAGLIFQCMPMGPLPNSLRAAAGQAGVLQCRWRAPLVRVAGSNAGAEVGLGILFSVGSLRRENPSGGGRPDILAESAPCRVGG